jgi:hypothetical protein
MELVLIIILLLLVLGIRSRAKRIMNSLDAVYEKLNTMSKEHQLAVLSSIRTTLDEYDEDPYLHEYDDGRAEVVLEEIKSLLDDFYQSQPET